MDWGRRVPRARIPAALVAAALVLLPGPGTGAEEPAGDAPAAREALRRGDLEAAATQLAEAAEAARAAGDAERELRLRVELAETQQALGSWQAAARSLERAHELAEASGDARRIAAVRGALGNQLVAAGSSRAAEQELSEAVALARTAGVPDLAAALANNLANHFALRAARARPGSPREALEARAAETYTAALADARRAGDAGLAARILANHARLALAAGQTEAAVARLAEARTAAEGLAPDHDNALTQIHVARTAQRLADAGALTGSQEIQRAHALLTRTHDAARARGDLRAAAWAQGTLGALYAGSGQLDLALELTRRAMFDAQAAGARDAELVFRGQAARLLARLGREEEALAAYRSAVAELALLRPALQLGYGSDVSFEEGHGRVHRELVDLLLRRAARGGGPAASLRAEAQRVMEQFKVAELRDYFRDDCVDAWRDRIATAADASLGALVVYPIVLDDRLELLVAVGGELRQYTQPVPKAELEAGVRGLRALLVKRTTREYLPDAQRAYDWLVRPWQELLRAAPDATVVFVPDGVLRTIPMAALHDGEKFLIERRPVATTPGLDLTDPRPLRAEDARVLLGGLSHSVQGFAPLPQVPAELDAIHALYGGDVLLDEAFVEAAVAERIESRPYGVVHLASHGVMEGDVGESYLLTHDGRIDLQELSAYVAARRFDEEPIELLTLSACETATGDERAALGLSGLAVKAGARSAIGALWKVNDAAASQLMVAFYRELGKPGTQRAVALQRAQQSLLADFRWRHPAHWAPFLVISNWQ